MPDISKINALAIGSVSKVDGLAKASILDIDGVAVPAGVDPPLDTYTNAAAAYSVRLLRTAYTGPVMRIRRENDDVQADLEFDSNDTISLSSPISNASSGTFTDLADFADHTGSQHDIHVVSWKDQSGNSKDADSEFTAQPYIYTGGTLQAVNGKSAVRVGYETSGLGVNTRASITGGVDYQTNSETFFTIVRYDDSAVGSAPQGAMWGPSNPVGNDVFWLQLDGTNFSYWANGNRGSNALLTTTTTQPSIVNTQFLFTGECDGSTMSIYIDGTLSDSKTATFSLTNGNFDDVFGNAQYYSEGYIQEFIVWADDRSSNRTNIETNLDDYYQIPGM